MEGGKSKNDRYHVEEDTGYKWICEVNASCQVPCNMSVFRSGAATFINGQSHFSSDMVRWHLSALALLFPEIPALLSLTRLATNAANGQKPFKSFKKCKPEDSWPEVC